MSADGADHLSELTQFRRELRPLAITRKALALGRSFGAPLYLISLGLIATWTVGVFFGVGFFYLVHPSEKQALRSGLGTRDTDVNPRFAERRRSPRFSTGEPTLIIARSAENGLVIQREFSVLAQLRVNPAPVDRESQALSVEPRILELRDDIERIRPPPFEAAGQPTVQQSAHPDTARERHKRRPSAAPMPRPHTPRQAIRDLLQKHARLLE